MTSTHTTLPRLFTKHSRSTSASSGMAHAACAALVAVASVADAHSEHPWRLHVAKTGEHLGTYQDFAACSQAAATKSRGTLACKPEPTATAATTLDAPTPVTLQPAASAQPVMQGGLQIDASVLPTGSAGFAFDRVQTTTEIAPVSEIGAFRTTCDFSHMAFDDPIVYPGKPGAAHLHAFFGNTGANASSTAESLRNTGNSTCRGGTINRTAYWVPAMIDTTTGKPLAPDIGSFYYKQGYQLAPSSIVQPIPLGLRMIAGDPSNSAPGGAGYRFKCEGGPNDSNDQYGPSIPNCDAGAQVVQEIFFPQCWDGKNLDAPDHKSHMSYPAQLQQVPWTWSCPNTHPVVLPQISFNILYTVPVQDAARTWRLSSDVYDSNLPGGYSSHGDWFNGWKPDISDTWARGCVEATRDCHSHLLGDGRMMY